MLRILVVEDDPDIRAAVASGLRDAGHTVEEAPDGAIGTARIAASAFDVVITDIRLPRVSGLEVFRAARDANRATEVILMTSFATVGDAVEALKKGAHDYLTKPFDVDELAIRVAAIDEKKALVRELEDARAKLAAAHDLSIVGSSPAMVRLLDRISTVAASEATVLLSGDSGTGKELVARRVHALSPRAAAPFVAVNCAAFPETLLEAELFGHERGAFTGAVKKRQGRFKAAHGGTLFLDEIGELPLPAQAKLLRAVQLGIIEPLGTNDVEKVDVRIISATNRDLKRAIAEGRFREDLYFRLNVVGVHLPPLRDRPGDLPLLFNHFLSRFVPAGAKPPEISLAAWQALSVYPFPGNVRELEHAVQHAVVLSRGGRVDVEHLPDDIVKVASATTPEQRAVVPLAQVLKQAERAHLLKALAITEGKRARAAELLGISRKNLWEKLRAHGIAESDFDDSGT
ncbi:MAG TPA: sigma-54 dependent transcriptional regulator [Polyangiaceae bacterium]|jgi:DNA-binding NtrC family response regulator